MDRRAFSLSLAALAASPNGASAQSQAQSLSNPKTFSHVGKSERPFRGKKEAILAEESGSGFLSHMWFGGDFPNYARLRIRVYVDHEEQPSINMELGMGAGFGFEDTMAPWGTKFSGKTGDPSGIYNFYRIPFTEHVRVTAELPAGVSDDQVFWWIIRGIQNTNLEVSGWQLPSGTRLRLYRRENETVQPLAELDLCQIQGRGMLFQTTIAAKSTKLDFLEAMMRAYIDGATEPQLLSSGLEDYFCGTYYFNRGPYHLPQSGLTHKDNTSFSAYRFHDEDPIFFTRGLRLTCRCGEKIGDLVFGDPRPTTYTTYAWVYEW
jgi:hypothetical protein